MSSLLRGNNWVEFKAETNSSADVFRQLAKKGLSELATYKLKGEETRKLLLDHGTELPLPKELNPLEQDSCKLACENADKLLQSYGNKPVPLEDLTLAVSCIEQYVECADTFPTGRAFERELNTRFPITFTIAAFDLLNTLTSPPILQQLNAEWCAKVESIIKKLADKVSPDQYIPNLFNPHHAILEHWGQLLFQAKTIDVSIEKHLTILEILEKLEAYTACENTDGRIACYKHLVRCYHAQNNAPNERQYLIFLVEIYTRKDQSKKIQELYDTVTQLLQLPLTELTNTTSFVALAKVCQSRFWDSIPVMKVKPEVIAALCRGARLLLAQNADYANWIGQENAAQAVGILQYLLDQMPKTNSVSVAHDSKAEMKVEMKEHNSSSDVDKQLQFIVEICRITQRQTDETLVEGMDVLHHQKEQPEFAAANNALEQKQSSKELAALFQKSTSGRTKHDIAIKLINFHCTKGNPCRFFLWVFQLSACDPDFKFDSFLTQIYKMSQKSRHGGMFGSFDHWLHFWRLAPIPSAEVGNPGRYGDKVIGWITTDLENACVGEGLPKDFWRQASEVLQSRVQQSSHNDAKDEVSNHNPRSSAQQTSSDAIDSTENPLGQSPGNGPARWVTDHHSNRSSRSNSYNSIGDGDLERHDSMDSTNGLDSLRADQASQQYKYSPSF